MRNEPVEGGEFFLDHSFLLAVGQPPGPYPPCPPAQCTGPVLSVMSQGASHPSAGPESCYGAHNPQCRAGVRPASGLQTSGQSPLCDWDTSGWWP